MAKFYSLHERAAKLFEQQDIEKAVFRYAQLNQNEPMARLISDYGSSMIKSGKLEILSKYVSLFPAALKDQYTNLWFYEGEVNRFSSVPTRLAGQGRLLQRHIERRKWLCIFEESHASAPINNQL